MVLTIQAEKYALQCCGNGSESLRGRVHSVFRHAVNFEMENQRLVTLALAPKPLPAQGMVVSREAFRGPANRTLASFLTPNGLLPFEVGEEIRLEAEVLESRHFVVDLTAAAVVDSCVRECVVRGKIADVLGQWLAETLIQKALVTGLRRETLYGSDRIDELGEAIEGAFWRAGDERARETGRVKQALERFIGFGEGLTPSGDDFIVGLLWGVTTDKRLEAVLLKILRRGLASLVNKTNDISGQMLQYAAEARFTESLVRLARADDRTDLCAVFENIAAFGHTSGLDTLCGLLTGLQISAHLVNSFQESAPTASSLARAVCAA